MLNISKVTKIGSHENKPKASFLPGSFAQLLVVWAGPALSMCIVSHNGVHLEVVITVLVDGVCEP